MDQEAFLSPVVTVPQPLSETVVPTTGTWFFPLLQELFQVVLPALLIALSINTFVIQPTRVDGVSMEPTLHSTDRLLIEKVTLFAGAPSHGDIVVLKLQNREQDPLIKRVIGVAGDVVAVHDGQVYLDGQPLNERYLDQQTLGDMAAQVVPDGHVFVLGDNRGASNDSRVFGMVPIEDIIGRAWLRYWPLGTIGLLP